MNILFFCSGSYVFGKEYVSLDVIKGLKDKGHHIEVIFSGWHDGQFQKMLNEIGVVSHPLKLGWYYITKLKWSIDSLVHYPGAVLKFLKIKKSFKPDVIYFDSFRNVFLLKPFLNEKTILHVHDPHSSKPVKKMLRSADSSVSQYIAVSQFIKDDIASAGIEKDKINVVYNGVYAPIDFKKQYLPDGILRIGIVGQIITRKGHADLFKACGLLKDLVNFQLHIYGSGDKAYKEYLEKLAVELDITDNIIWHGFTTDKNKIFSDIDVIVVPTTSEEPFALVPLEATMYMVPPVLYKSGGLPEGVIDGVTGYVLEKGDYSGIANILKMLYNDHDKIHQLGTAAREQALRRFSKNTMINEIVAVLQHLY